MFVDHNDTELLEGLARIREVASETYRIEYRQWKVGSLAEFSARRAFVNSLRSQTADSFRAIFGPQARGKLLLCARPFLQDENEGKLHYSRMPLIAAVALAMGASTVTPTQAFKRVDGAVGERMLPSLLDEFAVVLGMPGLSVLTALEETKDGLGDAGDDEREGKGQGEASWCALG